MIKKLLMGMLMMLMVFIPMNIVVSAEEVSIKETINETVNEDVLDKVTEDTLTEDASIEDALTEEIQEDEQDIEDAKEKLKEEDSKLDKSKTKVKEGAKDKVTIKNTSAKVTASNKTVKTNAITTKKISTTKVKVKESKNYSQADLKLLACLIQSEAGNQAYEGKLAVANVVLNRVNSKKFSHVNSIKAVIYDRKWAVQFSVTVNGALKRDLNRYSSFSTKSEKETIKAAKAALEGDNNIGSYLNFTGYSKSLANKYSNHRKIGCHIFF